MNLAHLDLGWATILFKDFVETPISFTKVDYQSWCLAVARSYVIP